jgi:hypothetical protein
VKNGHDLGSVGVNMRPDHAAPDTRSRRLGCACLAVLALGLLLAALACGAGLAWVAMSP